VVHGAAGATVTLPAGAALHAVLAVPSAGTQVTVTIPGQAADTPPADFPYSEDFKGGIGSGDVVIAGSVSYYRVTYEATS
jgi:hypothetical protein